MARCRCSIALGWAAALCASSSFAGEALRWQKNSVTLLHGDDFEQMNFNAEQQAAQTTVTLEHASGWVWGDIFAFYDHIQADNIQARGSRHNGTLHVSRHDRFYYMELSPRVSLSWLSNRALTAGPLKDVKAAFTYEKGNGGPGTENYLFGIGLDWQVPGFAFLQSNLYRVKINDHAFFAKHGRNGYAEQLTVTGAYPFSLGQQDFVIDGFVDWRSPSETAGTQTSLGSSLQFKWDAGKALYGEPRTLYLGSELNYWNNKYGVIPVDGSNDGFDQTVWQLLAKYHF